MRILLIIIAILRFTILQAQDITPPTAVNNTPINIPPNQAVQVSANFIDSESGIASATVLYRSIAGTIPNNFTSAPMSPAGGATYTADIPASFVTELGIEYKFLVVNGVGLDNGASQAIFKSFIRYPGLDITSYPANAAGTSTSSYRIIAIPLVLDNKTVNDVFSNVLGGYDPTIFRMFKYNGTSFDELNATSVLIPGEGYWFIAISSSPLNTGPGITVDVNTSSSFVINLKPGWNQIGNPYNFSISWADVVAANPAEAANLGGNGSKIRIFRGAVDNVDVLKSMEGGFVKYLGTASTPIKIPVSKNISIQGRVAAGSPAFNALDQPAWAIHFSLKNGNLEYNLGGIGMHPEAKVGFDFHDDFNGPRFIDYLEVKFPKKYVGMSYTKDVVPTSENYVWEFSVESNLQDQNASLSWDNSNFRDANNIYLLDVNMHKVIEMNNQSHYEFNRVASKNFKVVFGNTEFVKQELMPSRIFLYDPFPNPFVNEVSIGFALPKEVSDGQAEIQIYNSTGTSIVEMQTSVAGIGSWIWESDHPPGLYFIRLRAGNQSVTKKVIKRK